MKKIMVISILGIWVHPYNIFAIPAFPGAEWAGANATGGRGGEVRIVTNLNNDGAGSLRWAIWSASDRIVVFRVSGTIELASPLGIPAGGPDITIAGQTAPGDGICIKNYPFEIKADNVIIRYLRVRPGISDDGDGITVNQGQNIILDHYSVSWGADETLSTAMVDTADVLDNLTVQWCIISEGLAQTGHSAGSLI